MSEFQAGLIAVGVLVVAAVLVYNRLQERSFRREADASLRSEHADVLMGGATSSAGAKQQRTVAGAVPGARHERVEPILGGAGSGHVPAPDALALAESLDFIVTIEAREDLGGAELRAAAAGPLSGFPKRIRLEGYNERMACWEDVLDPSRYALMRAGIQLVDRQGAVGAEDLARFGAAVQAVSEVAGALATVPESEAALAQAAALDRFCAENDILVAVGVESAGGDPFAGTRLRALAESAGMVLDADGRFRRRDEADGTMWELANRDGPPFSPETMHSIRTTGISLEFDVPRAPGGLHSFDQFREFAIHLAQGLDGRPVDDNRRPLTSEALGQIAMRVEAVQLAMRERGFDAGGRLALRLFS